MTQPTVSSNEGQQLVSPPGKWPISPDLYKESEHMRAVLPCHAATIDARVRKLKTKPIIILPTVMAAAPATRHDSDGDETNSVGTV